VTTASGPLSHRIKKIKLHPTLPVVLDVTGVISSSSLIVRLQNENFDHAVICRTPRSGVVEMNKLSAPELMGIKTQDQIANVVNSNIVKIRNIFSSLLAIVFFISALSISALNYTNVIDLRIVQTNSMSPSINPGDMIIGISPNYREPKINDVAVFTARTLDGQPVAPFSHRIIAGDGQNGWETKGDANSLADVFEPASSDVIAVVIATLPFGGLLVSLKPVLIALISGMLVYVILRK
jgi:signal peptidase I